MAIHRYTQALIALLLLFCPFFAVGQEIERTRQLIVEGIEVEGNSKTKLQVISRYLVLEEGGPITPEALLVSKQRLIATQFFKQADVYTRPGSQKGRVVVVVEVEERKWPYYRFEGGHGDLDGWYVAPVGFCFDNFSGRGHQLDWKWKIGNRIARDELHYRHPYMMDGAGALDVQLFGEEQSFFHFIDGNEVEEMVKSGGVFAQLSGTGGRYRHAFIAGRGQHFRPVFQPLLASLFPDDFRNTRIAALVLGLQGDTRDSDYYPLKGLWGRLSGELALGSAANFPKIEMDIRFYQRMSKRNVFALRLHGGYVGEDAPFFERFYLGGPYSLRGYQTGRLTPVGWGTKLFLVQSEMRFPLSEKKFPQHKHTAVIYCDLGGIWLPGELPGPGDLSRSLGVGYRRRTKVIGVLRIDFSLPSSAVDENDFRFQISLGNTF